MTAGCLILVVIFVIVYDKDFLYLYRISVLFTTTRGWLIMRQKITNKRIIQATFLSICMMGLLVASTIQSQREMVDIVDDSIPLSESNGVLIKETDADINVIPDKYNCGAKGQLTVVTAGETINNVKFKCSSGKNVMEFGYGNQNISGTVTFENLDFSNNDMGFYNEGLVDRDIKVVFNNCVFAQIKTSELASRMRYEFNNCTIKSFYGCNAVFNRCLFGESYKDAIIPFQNVTVNDCFIKDMSSTDPSSAGIHSDGTQMFGHKNSEVKDVYFNNCRFEVPAIQTGGNSASVNACIMVQLEYNNGTNIQFTNCKINGGGYSIYARTTKPEFHLNNVVFNNIDVGCAKLFKTVYSKVSDGVVFNNVNETDSLYIASVWQDGGATHFSVTNDTNIDRKLLIYTDTNSYSFEIPKCPDGKNLYDNFGDYPFDIDIVIPEVPRYAVCFESTTEGQCEQLRFANWGKQDVYINLTNEKTDMQESMIEEFGEEVAVKTPNGGAAILTSGTCGKNVNYSLDAEGVLHLWGNGATCNYHSKNSAPWYKFREKIVAIEVSEGIEKIGNQCFRDCTSVKVVSLPETLEVIGYNAFIRCSGLKEVTIPGNVHEIDAYAFAGTKLEKCIYRGDRGSWNKIAVGIRNERILSNLLFK